LDSTVASLSGRVAAHSESDTAMKST
jgi:hypothetical protein